MSKQEVALFSTEFQPKNEYLLIKPQALETERITGSGIVIQSNNRSALHRPTYGEVLSVGKDIDDIITGDFVIWPVTDGLDMELLDGDFMLLRYKSVIGMKKRDNE